MTINEFEARLYLSSVQLVRIGEEIEPNCTASGALIDYGGKRVLLTVEHATRDQKRWAIQLRHDPGKGTKVFGLGAMCFLRKGKLADPKKAVDFVDFSYVEVPTAIRAFRQELDDTGATILREAPITVHTASLSDVPEAGENYGFCGMVMAAIEHHPRMTALSGEIRVNSGLKYLRTEDDFHIFELPFPHPGHDHFEGCSGAPVLGENGKLVGLISGGDIPSNTIHVLALAKYKVAIDILVGNV